MWVPNLQMKKTKTHISSVVQSCPTLCDPMDCSMPGFPVHHNLPKFVQTHVHWIDNAIQPSHPLSSPSPASNLSQHQGLSSELAPHIRWPKYWSFSLSISPSKEYSGLISFRIDWLDLLAVQGISRVHDLLPFVKVLCRHLGLTPSLGSPLFSVRLSCTWERKVFPVTLSFVLQFAGFRYWI